MLYYYIFQFFVIVVVARSRHLFSSMDTLWDTTITIHRNHNFTITNEMPSSLSFSVQPNRPFSIDIFHLLDCTVYSSPKLLSFSLFPVIKISLRERNEKNKKKDDERCSENCHKKHIHWKSKIENFCFSFIFCAHISILLFFSPNQKHILRYQFQIHTQRICLAHRSIWKWIRERK